MFLPLGWWHQVTALDVSLSFSYSCLAVPNQFDYPDPAAPPSPPSPPTPKAARTTADAMQAELMNAVTLAGGIVEAQLNDGSAIRFRASASGMQLQVDRMDSRASHYAQRIGGLAKDGRAMQCSFADGSSIRIEPFG
jgi:hypothetical protein